MYCCKKVYEMFLMQIASHPNIYVLDTPSVLPPNVIDDEVCSKLAITGTITLPLILEKLRQVA